MKKFFVAVIVAASLFFASTVNAEVQTYTGEGEYYMSDFETFDTAQQRAKQRAEQNACEQAGVFVKSFSRSVNSKLVEDEITALTSGILNILNVQYQREHFDNNTTLIRVTVHVNIDSNDVLKWLNKDDADRKLLVAQNAELREKIAEQDRLIAELKKKFDSASQQVKEQITREVADADKIFLSKQKVSEAWRLFNQNDFAGATKIFSEAIELDPNNSAGYYGRAYAQDGLKNYRQAVEDNTRAIELAPAFVNAYNNRGEAYRKSENFTAAIQDYNKALELNPAYVKAYNNRGIVYRKLGNYAQAFADYDKAIQLNPNYATAYYNRGYAHMQQKNYSAAIDDFTKYIQLAPNDSDGYDCRGKCYQALGDEAKAQADFTKASELN